MLQSLEYKLKGHMVHVSIVQMASAQPKRLYQDYRLIIWVQTIPAKTWLGPSGGEPCCASAHPMTWSHSAGPPGCASGQHSGTCRPSQMQHADSAAHCASPAECLSKLDHDSNCQHGITIAEISRETELPKLSEQTGLNLTGHC